MTVLLKKGAMFGLDARIALAIFGALSVISGAALYSAIQNAKATSILVDLKEVGKAWEAYYLDTGESLPQVNDSTNAEAEFYFTKTAALVKKSVGNSPLWSGPYINYEIDPDHYSLLMHNKYRHVHVLLLNSDTTWGNSVFWFPDGACFAGKDCHIWVKINGIDNDSLAKIIDKKIDNADGYNKGNFRWLYKEDEYAWRYILKVAPIKNPND